MKFLKLAYSRVKALFRRRRLEQDLDVEMRLHLDLLSEEYERAGMCAADAKRSAFRRFGNVGHIKEQARDIRGAGILGDLVQDVYYAARTFRNSPIFLTIVVVSLGLGIGANTALFSAINGRYFKTLPVKDPAQLVRLKWSGRNEMAVRTSEFGYSPDDGRGNAVRAGFSYRAYQEFRKNNTTLEELLAFAPVSRVSVVMDGRAEVASALLISGTYFTTLGVGAGAGRAITPDDDGISAPAVAMISDSYWNRRFAADPDVIGKMATINNLSVTIVGVTPRGFNGVQQLEDSMADIVLPLSADPKLAGGGRMRILSGGCTSLAG
jgi:MacB-like periplasmic core domain